MCEVVADGFLESQVEAGGQAAEAQLRECLVQVGMVHGVVFLV